MKHDGFAWCYVHSNIEGVDTMKLAIEVCLIGSILICVAGAQKSPKRSLQKGISVAMPVASRPVEMRAADEPNATIVAITAGGKVYVGINDTEPIALSNLSAGTVYVKADSRVPYQKVLTVLEALRGKSVVLLTAPPTNVETTGVVPPYGMKLMISP
jgi:hypothetical protein